VVARRIARLFAPYRLRLGLVFLLIVAASLIALVPPFLLREILDVAIPRGRTTLLTMLAASMLGLAATSNAIGVLQSYMSLTIGQDVLNDLRNTVYAHLQRMSLAFFTRTRNGEVQSRIANDIGGMATTITGVATSVVASVATIGGSLAAMVGLNWRLTIVSLSMLPVFVFIARKIGNERRVITKERQEQLAVMSTLVEESLSVNGFLLGRVLGRSRLLTDEFAHQSRTLTDLLIRSAMAGRWRGSCIQLIMTAMPITIYWTAGISGHHGRPGTSIGTLVAFTGLQQGLFGPVLQLLQVGITIQSSMALFDRVFEYIDLPVDIREPANPTPLPGARDHVRFEHVYFDYGQQRILHDIQIELPPGRHLAVVGATGAGKTTLGYLVPRLYDVTAGRVTIDGVDVREMAFSTLAEIVGVVSQDTHLFHTTIADNLRFAKPAASDRELVSACSAAQIHELIAGLPDGYETIVGERGYRFSGGEKQRLAIARTMLRNPRVLVLDEATSALDTRTESAVQEALDTLSAGRTTITIAHRLSTIRDADEIIMLDHGHIVERGTHHELIRFHGSYQELITRNQLVGGAQ
jgi:ATP-binding cassette subfamily B protein